MRDLTANCTRKDTVVVATGRGTYLKSFRDALRNEDFAVSAYLAVDPATTLSELRTQAALLSPRVHALQIGDNWRAEGHIDPVTIAGALLGDGIDTVVHLSGRDRNRIALQGALLAAASTGVGSLMLSRGEKLPERLRGKVKGVFDTRGAQLYELARRVGHEAGVNGDTGFHIGTYAPVINPPEDWSATQIEEKIGSGVDFIQTRPCLNADMLDRYMRAIVARKITHRIPLVVELPVLTSANSAQDFRDLYPGTRIPSRIAEKVAGAADPAAAGIELAATMLVGFAATPGVSGANIVSDGDAQTIVDVLETAGLVA